MTPVTCSEVSGLLHSPFAFQEVQGKKHPEYNSKIFFRPI